MADDKMSREEAGRKGGEATSKNHDKEFYQEIGQKGGEATTGDLHTVRFPQGEPVAFTLSNKTSCDLICVEVTLCQNI